MKVVLFLIFSLLTFQTSVPSSASANKLDRVREAVRDDDDNNNNNNTSLSKDSDSHDHYDFGTASPDDSPRSSSSSKKSKEIVLVAACFTPIGWFMCPPLFVLNILDSSEGRGEKHVYLQPHPYANNAVGYVHIERRYPASSPSENEGPENKTVSTAGFRLSVEYNYDFEGLHIPALGFRLTSSSRVGFQTHWKHYIEPTEGGLDRLTMGDMNLHIRFAESERWQFYIGPGLRLMFDEEEVNAGFNFTYGVDILPINPLLLSFELDLGHLGEAFFAQVRGTVGLTFAGWEVFGGFEATLIDPVPFFGPTAGIRAWF